MNYYKTTYIILQYGVVAVRVVYVVSCVVNLRLKVRPEVWKVLFLPKPRLDNGSLQ